MAGRRGRSGPPGNQNARRHGLYARALSAAQAARLRSARRLPLDLREEIALLRSRLAHLVEAEPQNIAALTDGLRTMTRMLLAQRQLRGEETDPTAFEAAVQQVLEELVEPLLDAGRPRKS